GHSSFRDGLQAVMDHVQAADVLIVHGPLPARSPSSWTCPGLSRASTYLLRPMQDVDGRDKPGNDSWAALVCRIVTGSGVRSSRNSLAVRLKNYCRAIVLSLAAGPPSPDGGHNR